MNNLTLLFVDDDPEELEILTGALETMSSSISIHYEMNGELALTWLNNVFSDGYTPSLIVLDLNMPKKNGTQTLEALKHDPRFQHIPVVIYSTSLNTFERNKCMDLGAHSYITKPISYADTLETMAFFVTMIDKCQQEKAAQ